MLLYIMAFLFKVGLISQKKWDNYCGKEVEKILQKL